MPARAGHDLGQSKEERMGCEVGWSGKGAGLVALAGQEEKGEAGWAGWLRGPKGGERKIRGKSSPREEKRFSISLFGSK